MSLALALTIHNKQNCIGQHFLFTFRRAAFSSQLKSKVGIILVKAAALRIVLNIDDTPISSNHTISTKARSVDKDWEFVSKGTEISMGRFVSEHFTPLTLDIKTGVISDEDTEEIWETVKEVVIEKVRRNKNRASGGDSILIDEEEVEKSFWLSRPDG